LLIGIICRHNFGSTHTTEQQRIIIIIIIMKFASSLVFALGFAAQSLAFAPSMAPKLSTSLNAGVLTKTTGQSSLDPAVIERYNTLPFPKDSILAEYVWTDAVGNTRSKTRTLPAAKGKSVDSLPKWNFDGSSTDQAPGDDSEVILRPCRIFKDPFRPRSDGADNILVMCDTYTPAGEPLESNTRAFGKSCNL
jgi:glutamine synthetase